SGAGDHAEVSFLVVGTPAGSDGRADLSQVETAATTLGGAASAGLVLAQKSTVPVGTGALLEDLLRGTQVEVASTPEFLQEGRAVRDTLEPDRIVVGASSDGARARLRHVYRPILDATGCPFVDTDVATAELIKLASNAFLATKVSFVNMIADICERVGADVGVLAEAMG